MKVTDTFILDVKKQWIWVDGYDSTELTIGKTVNLTADVGTYDGDNKTVVWETNNSSVATVDNGLVTPVGTGIVAITAKLKKYPDVYWQVVFEVKLPGTTKIEITNVSNNTLNLSVDDTFQLEYAITPNNVLDKTVTWESMNPEIANVDKNGIVTAYMPGSTTIKLTSNAEGRKSTAIAVEVKRHSDPFHHTNIEYVRIKKYDRSSSGGDSDITTIVTKSYTENSEYFECYAPNRNTVAFKVSQNLKNTLKNQVDEYLKLPIVDVPSIYAAPPSFCYYLAKLGVDQMVEDGEIEANSCEYYGIWTMETETLLREAKKSAYMVQLSYALVTTAYSIYNIVTNIKSAQMSASQSKVYTNASYSSVAESQKSIADISDDMAIQMGKTDTLSVTGVRRSWRASEMRAAEEYQLQYGYQYNQSYKIVNNKLTKVPYGTSDSQRLDLYNPTSNHIVEVKNYTITTSTGRNNLANNIANQYNKRITMFPNAKIDFLVDVYGQDYTQEMLDDILRLVKNKIGDKVVVEFLYD